MRRLAAILGLVLGLILLAAPPASAVASARVENRASGSATAPNSLIGIEARLSEAAVRGNIPLAYDFASDDAVAARGIASLPSKPGQLGHIFRNARGHLADTPANRQLLTDVASNPANRIGVDAFGNVRSALIRPDGTQVWVSTRNGVIQNGGLNQVPQAFPNIVGP